MMVELKNNFFSVIIPLYNKVEYIERAILSIINQTYQNFEIIVVNDGSSDNGEIIVKSIKDRRITLINQQNQGVSIARNNGVNYSNYDFIAFLDADDIWDLDFLSELNILINKYPDSGIYGINHYCKFANDKVSFENYKWLFQGKKNGLIEDYFKTFAKLGKSPFSNSGCCFPKEVFLKVGGYQPGIRTTEDSDLWCRIALNFAVAFSIQPLVTYYLEIPNNTRKIIEYQDFQVSQTLQEYLITKQIPEKFIQSVNHLIAFQQLSLVKRAILTGNNKFAISKLSDKRLVSHYPFKTISHYIIALVPNRIFLFLWNLLKKIRG